RVGSSSQAAPVLHHMTVSALCRYRLRQSHVCVESDGPPPLCDTRSVHDGQTFFATITQRLGVGPSSRDDRRGKVHCSFHTSRFGFGPSLAWTSRDGSPCRRAPYIHYTFVIAKEVYRLRQSKCDE